MRLRYQVRSPRVTVGIKAGHAAAFHPPIELLFTVFALQHHLIVISQNTNKVTARFESKQFLNHAARIETAIDVVAQRNDDVLLLEMDRGNQRFESHRTSVNIANSDGTSSTDCNARMQREVGRIHGSFTVTWEFLILLAHFATCSRMADRTVGASEHRPASDKVYGAYYVQ
jgi:hypothetical protein